MIILADNDLHRFRIKQLQREIEVQLKQWRDEEVLKRKYLETKGAWERIFIDTGHDYRQLWLLKFELERELYNLY